MITKQERKDVWIDQIKTARYLANEAITNIKDDGTCNFDSVDVMKEKWFTYEEMVQMFNECGLSAYKHQGCVRVCGIGGQAYKRQVWAETFSKELSEQGFKTSMWYQLD